MSPSLLHFALLHPLPLRALSRVGVTLIAALTVWCQLTNFLEAGHIPPLLSAQWATIHVLTWGCAWEWLKRIPSGRALREWLLPLLTALCVCALGHFLLFWAWYGNGSAELLEILYDRTPIAALLGVSAQLLRQLPTQSGVARVGEHPPHRATAQRSASAIAPPYLAERLTETHQTDAPADRRADTRSPGETHLEVPTRQGILQIDIPDIDYLKAAANYVEIFFAEKTSLLRSPLSELATRVEPHGFMRIHRSLVINRRRVARVHNRGKQPSLVLHNGTRLPIGRQYLDAVCAAFVVAAPEALGPDTENQLPVRPGGAD